MRFIGRALALILAFLLGFMSFFIAIAAGGFYVYTSLTYNDLVDKGIAPSIDGIVDGENADVDITNSTLQDFVKEFLALQNMGANAITVDSLLNRYQIKLPENIQQYIPDSIRSIAFSDLFTSSGMNTVLENTSLDYAFQYIPDGVLSEPAKETLKGKSFAEVLSMDFENLLQDLKLGYLIGTNYNLVDGVYVIEYQDPDNPSMMELVSDLDLGRVLASVNGHDNLMEVMVDCLGQIVLDKAINSIGIANDLVSSVLSDKKLEDLLKYDAETGGYSFDIGAIINNRYIGEFLGYTPVYASSKENAPLIGWKDADGNSVTGVFRGLACAKIEDFGTESFNYMTLLNGFYFGDVLGYVPSFDSEGLITEWKTPNGEDIEVMFSTLVSKKISDLFKEETIYLTDFLGDMYVGTFLGYTYVTNPDDSRTWSETKEGVQTEVTGLYKVLADINLGEVVGGSFDFATITNNLKVGTVLGYYEEADVWYKDSTKAEELTGMYKALSSIDIGKLISGEADITDSLNGLLVGDILGYYKEADVWYKDSTKAEEVSGLYKALADVDLGKIISGESEITDSFVGVYVGDLLGYVKDSDIWYTDSSKTTPASGIFKAVAGIDLGKLLTDSSYKIEDAFEGLFVGDLLGYTKDSDVWYTDAECTSPVTGIYKAVSSIDIGKLLTDSSYKIEDSFQALFVGDLLGYKKVGLVWVDSSDNEVTGINEVLADVDIGKLIDGSLSINSIFTDVKMGKVLGYAFDSGIWYTDATLSTPVTGINKTLAELDLGKLLAGDGSYELADAFQGTYVGDMLGYTKPATEWLDSSSNPVTGLNAIIADVDLYELIKGSLDVNSIFDGVVLGTVLGYSLDTGVWYKDSSHSVPLTGIDKAIAKIEIGKLLTDSSYKITDAFDGIKLGDLLGYTLDSGIWYSDSTKTTRITGINKKLATIDLGELMGDSFDIMSIFTGMYVGEALNYTLDSGIWYTDSTKTTPVTGINKAVANINLGSLLNNPSYQISSAFEGTKLGDLLGYTLDSGIWYSDSTKTTPITGINKKLANIDLGELMGDSFDIMSIFTGMYVGEALNYTLDSGIWYTDSTKTTPVTGINKAVANINLGSLLNDSSYNIASAFTGTKLGELLGYTKVGGVWKDRTSQNVTGINKKLAEIDLGTLMGDTFDIMSIFDGMFLGEALGYTKDSGVWYTDATLATPVGGLNKTIADIDLGRLLDGDPSYDITSVFATTKIGDVLGYEETVSGWTNGGTPVTGFMKVVASKTMNNLDGLMTELTIADVMDYKLIAGVYYESDGVTPVTGMMKTLAPITVGNISSCLDDMTLADALGYEKIAGVWYESDGVTRVSGFLSSIADSKINQLSSKLSTLKIGEIMGWSYEGGTWMDGSDPANGILVVFASFTIDDMTNSTKVSTAVQSLTLGQALGYIKIGGVWYQADGVTPAANTGFLCIVKYDGARSYDVPVGHVTDAITDTFDNTTMQEYIDNGIITIDSAKQSLLDTIKPGWRDQTINEFISALI